MAIATARRLYGPAALGTTNAVLYTVPGSTTTIVKEITLVNTTGTAAACSLAINGTAVTAANCAWAKDYSLPANATVIFAVSTVLAAADTVQGIQGTTGAVTVSISGTEFI